MQADASPTCIRLKLSGASHVLFGGLLIGPNKDPQRGFAYERSVPAVGGGAGDWLESETGSRPVPEL